MYDIIVRYAVRDNNMLVTIPAYDATCNAKKVGYFWGWSADGRSGLATDPRRAALDIASAILKDKCPTQVILQSV